MDEHGKKKIAPVLITVIIVLYYTIYFAIIMSVVPFMWKLLLGIIPVSLAVGMIYVCIERLKEIDKGEEDDLSKY